MLEVVHSTLRQFHMIAPGDRVVVGVSGGADSVALFLHLCEYQKEVDFTLEVVHVNHLIRDDAAADADFVKTLSDDRGINYHLFEVDVCKEAERLHLSTEEAGRKIRYEAMRSLGPTKIAVGHHSDDLAETVLLNLCRGTGIHGMAGIAPVWDDIIRPLLFVTRDDIEAYLDKLCQPYRTDSTILSDDYTRNKIRLNILPYLNREINDKTSEHIVNMAQDMMEIESLVDGITSKALRDICIINKDKKEIRIDKNGLHNLDNYIRRELLLRALEELTPKRKDITRTHIQSIIDITDKSGEKRISLPYDLEAVSSYDRLIIRQKKSGNLDPAGTVGDYSFTLDISPDSSRQVSVTLPDGRALSARIFAYDKGLSYPEDRCTKWLDYDKINESVTLRYRRTGDYLMVSDSMQRKPLKDYMINEKIPKEDRDKLPVVTDGSHVMWVPGYRISAYYKLSEQTKTIIELKIN